MTQDQSKTPEPNSPASPSPEATSPDVAREDTVNVDAASGDIVSVDAASGDAANVDTTSGDTTSAEISQVTDAILEAGTLEVAESDLSELVDEQASAPAMTASEVENPPVSALNENASGATARSSASQIQEPAGHQPSEQAKSAEQATGTVQTLLRLGRQLWGIVLALTPFVVNVLRWIWDISLKVLDWLWATWKALLPKLKPLLPASLSRSPDWLLTTIAFSLVLFVLWLVTTLLPGKAPSVATEPVPPKLVAPAPVIDADKIARLQSQVAEVTEQYAEGLIEAVQANFVRGRLIVQVGENWYTIDAANQDKVANEILKRSRRLDFTQLELMDAEGTLVARSPVVGSGMVVYERTKQAG